MDQLNFGPDAPQATSPGSSTRGRCSSYEASWPSSLSDCFQLLARPIRSGRSAAARNAGQVWVMREFGEACAGGLFCSGIGLVGRLL